MFQAETRTQRLQLVQGGKERSRSTKGVRTMNTMNMNEYKFAEYPSNSSVASGVTMLVSAWFLVAAGAILADPPSPYTQQPGLQARTATVTVAQISAAPRLIPAMATAPAARFTITVEAKRLKV
jgi:hypothetical protein